ncbi:uncharacterized protein J3D65DRAFT_605484 [Phyllosticta citribraziliensis]|uniref:Uncharacterized protein n=1 Tax=Phyllosticta citribraziliensis TaxID=989973 RepID=A0ABR1LGQ5_9PEZI
MLPSDDSEEPSNTSWGAKMENLVGPLDATMEPSPLTSRALEEHAVHSVELNKKRSSGGSVDTIVDQSGNSLTLANKTTSHSIAAENSVAPLADIPLQRPQSRSRATTTVSFSGFCRHCGSQVPPPPPQSARSIPTSQSEIDLDAVNDGLIGNPKNTPAVSSPFIHGSTSPGLPSIEKRLESLQLSRAIESDAATTEIFDNESDSGGVKVSPSPTQVMARRQTEMMSSGKPVHTVIEYADWEEEMLSAFDNGLKRLTQAAHDDHARRPSISFPAHFERRLCAALSRDQSPYDLESKVRQLKEQTKRADDQARRGDQLADLIVEQAKVTNQQAKSIAELTKLHAEQGKVLAEQNKVLAEQNKSIAELQVCALLLRLNPRKVLANDWKATINALKAKE